MTVSSLCLCDAPNLHLQHTVDGKTRNDVVDRKASNDDMCVEPANSSLSKGLCRPASWNNYDVVPNLPRFDESRDEYRFDRTPVGSTNDVGGGVGGAAADNERRVNERSQDEGEHREGSGPPLYTLAHMSVPAPRSEGSPTANDAIVGSAIQ